MAALLFARERNPSYLKSKKTSFMQKDAFLAWMFIAHAFMEDIGQG